MKPRTAIKAQALASLLVEASVEEEEIPVGVWQVASGGWFSSANRERCWDQNDLPGKKKGSFRMQTTDSNFI